MNLATNVCLGTVFHPTPGDHSELVAPPVTIEEEAKSVDAADSSVMQYTASELDILLEATTTLLHVWYRRHWLNSIDLGLSLK